MRQKLLTPGPLTTSAETKKAMLNDFGSRDKEFMLINSFIRESLLRMINGENFYECIPLQGSGTFAVESMIGSLVPKQSKILILINGAYGHRIKTICSYLNIDSIDYEVPEDQIHDLVKVEKIIEENQDLTHVFIVYCETTSGILNPIENIANLVSNKNLSLFIDAMSAFGALPLSCKDIEFDAVAASSNKCLEGVPGVGFDLVKKDLINSNEFKEPFEVLVDTEFNPNGCLIYGEALKNGNSNKEILLSTYFCHPSLANDNLSGLITACILFKYLSKCSRLSSYC